MYYRPSATCFLHAGEFWIVWILSISLLCYLHVKLHLAFKIHDPSATFTGAAQCLGELYRYFGRRITSGLYETTIIVTKILKFNEVMKLNLVQCLSDLFSFSLLMQLCWVCAHIYLCKHFLFPKSCTKMNCLNVLFSACTIICPF